MSQPNNTSSQGHHNSFALFESYFVLRMPLCEVFPAKFFLKILQVKLVGQHAAVARLWEIVGPLLQDHGFNAGTGLSSTCSQSGGLNPPLFQMDSREPRERRTSTSSVVFVDGGVQSPPLSPLAKVKFCVLPLMSVYGGDA